MKDRWTVDRLRDAPDVGRRHRREVASMKEAGATGVVVTVRYPPYGRRNRVGSARLMGVFLFGPDYDGEAFVYNSWKWWGAYVTKSGEVPVGAVAQMELYGPSSKPTWENKVRFKEGQVWQIVVFPDHLGLWRLVFGPRQRVQRVFVGFG